MVFVKKVQIVCDLQPRVFPALPTCPVLQVTYVERTFASILFMIYASTIIHSYASELDDLEWDEESFAYKDDPYSRAAPIPPASNVSSTAPSVYAERAPLFMS